MAGSCSGETFFAFSASILVGLGLGILLSKLAELLLCNMLQFEIRYAWEFIPRAFLRTGSIFLLYAALMLLHSLWQLRKAKPVELLHSVSAGEREPWANWLLALVGLVPWAQATGWPSPSRTRWTPWSGSLWL